MLASAFAWASQSAVSTFLAVSVPPPRFSELAAWIGMTKADGRFWLRRSKLVRRLGILNRKNVMCDER